MVTIPPTPLAMALPFVRNHQRRGEETYHSPSGMAVLGSTGDRHDLQCNILSELTDVVVHTCPQESRNIGSMLTRLQNLILLKAKNHRTCTTICCVVPSNDNLESKHLTVQCLRPHKLCTETCAYWPCTLSPSGTVQYRKVHLAALLLLLGACYSVFTDLPH